MKTGAAAITGMATAAAAQSTFGLIASHSTSPIHLQTVNANGQAFWVGKDTATYCPPNIEGINCPVGSGYTEFTIGGSVLGLDVVVPGGQQIYVDPADGRVGFTQAHSASVPTGAIRDGWSLSAYGANGLAELTNSNGGALFCAASADAAQTGPWELHLALEGLTFGDECIGAGLIAANATSTPGAWQYS